MIRNSYQEIDPPIVWQVDYNTERLVRRLKTECSGEKKKTENRFKIICVYVSQLVIPDSL